MAGWRSKPPRTRRYGRTSLLAAPACLIIAAALCVLLRPSRRLEQASDSWLEDGAHAVAAYHALMRHQLLLATHSRLFWYDTHTGDVTVLHEGQVGAGAGRRTLQW
jgi:hypothetical protein